MGGKAKGAQRTKGNQRPASSAKALAGFAEGSFNNSIMGFTEDSMDIDSTVDPIFQMVLRKMSKKDSTTKIKALKEFADLVNQSDVDSVKTTLSFFPKVYVQLSCDPEARVRENSQIALMAIIDKIGKQLALILKQIFPSWLCGQYDQHPTAASIATSCFEKAFPARKVGEVFAFCESETLDYFTKNLTILNTQTICNPKTYSPEECEAKYQRAVISCLRGYALYLEKIPPEKLILSTSRNMALVKNERFWSLQKSKVPQIRSAFFEALSALLQHGSFLFAGFEEQLTLTVFKAIIDESDPTLLSHIWTCIILIQVKVESWGQFVNIKKMLLPQLWKILRTAIAPCVIYPNLLPFISNFQKELFPDGAIHNFYVTFFENINFGLRNVRLGKSEISAVASAYYEILQYIIIQIVNDDDDAYKFNLCSSLLDDHIIAVIFWCINAEGSFGKYIFNHIALLVNYWSRNSKTIALYQELLARFWSELYQVLINSLGTSSNVKYITSSHVDLVKNLKIYSQNQKARVAKIKFEDTAKELSSPLPYDEKTNDCGSKRFVQNLHEMVYKLCCVYTERISSTQAVEFVENLEALIKMYQSQELFQYMAGCINPDEVNICSLYDVFSAWLLVPELCCESVIEIILVLYKYLNSSEKIDLLNRWIKVPSVQSWIIMRALSYPLCMEADITELLKMQEVEDHLEECARQATNGIYKENLIILQKCFFQNEEGNILINAKTCKKIIDIMCEPLKDESRIGQMDQCGSFLAQILPVICFDAEKKDLQQKIFLNLFEFSIVKELSDHLSEDTLWEVNTAWQDAISSNDLKLDEFLLKSCAKIINDKIKCVSINGMERFADVASKLIVCSTEHETTDKSLLMDELILNLFNKTNGGLTNYIENLSLSLELMHGTITLTNIEDVPNRKDFPDALDCYLKNNIFMLEVLIKLSCNIRKEDTENVKKSYDDELEARGEMEFSEWKKQLQDEEATEDFCDIDGSLLKEWTEGIINVFLSVSYAEAVCSILLTRMNSLLPEFENWIIYMQGRLRLLMNNVSEQIAAQTEKKLVEMANAKGGLWSKCMLNLLSTKTYAQNGATLLYENSVVHANPGASILSYINILQAFSGCIRSLPIDPNLFEKFPNLLMKVSASRSLMKNHLDVDDFNDIGDKKVVGNAIKLMNEIIMKQKTEAFLLYNKDVSLETSERVLLTAEVAHFLSDVLTFLPSEVDVRRWDFIRIALSSWVLSVSKSCEKFDNNAVKVFISAIFKLNAALFKFIASEKTKSSTQMLHNIIEEWEKVFAREVNLVLIKSFILIVNHLDYESKHQECFVDTLCPFIGSIDFSYILQSQKVDQTFSLKDLIAFALENISNKYHGVCVASATILKKLTRGILAFDNEILLQRNSEDDTGKNIDDGNIENNRWHFLDTFRETLEYYNEVIKEFIEDFNFKVNELNELTPISPNIAFSYLLLWDCILNFCSQAPAELRSIYARWITSHKFEEVFFIALFKLMPRDIIKNPEASVKSGHIAFSALEWREISNSKVNNHRYAAFIYAESLRTIPAIVRKWWHASNTRQAQLVEKITQNYVSPILCQQDLTVLINRNENNNMNIRVLMQSREIFATYSLDEAKMELTISLPPNYPLGAIKIDSTKHIAGKLQTREIVKQLSIYLTHQNGRLYDGISLWKRNLDRKYEGVEECYVCYSVINQETCQLPRLTCKTCKKKFHSNCLYKWFTSSNRSTCPLCRNAF